MELRDYNKLQVKLFLRFQVEEMSVLFFRLCSCYAMFREEELKYSVVKTMIMLTKEEISYCEAQKNCKGRQKIRCYTFNNGTSVVYKSGGR